MTLALNHDACYEALRSRDARFDGQFFVAVSSTGIYCRPICRVRVPASKNCRFFEKAAQAEANGFRPCLRCRPEMATRWSTEHITESLAEQALKLFDDSFTEADVIATVGQRLGVSERHLRRLFAQYVGVNPLQYVQTRRLLFAKQLLVDSSLRVSDIALIVGFGSVRRFNTLLRTRYGLTPTELRQSNAPTSARLQRSSGPVRDDALSCFLKVTTPYDFPAMLAFHAARAVHNLEDVQAGVYSRALSIENPDTHQVSVGWYSVEVVDDQTVRLSVSNTLSFELAKVMAIVKAQFDLDTNPHHWSAALSSLPGYNPGLRVPGGVSGLELSVRAILGQQISVSAATTLVARVVDRFGGQGAVGGPSRTFPTAHTLANCRADTLGEMGIIRTRATAIKAIAAAIDQGHLNLNPGGDVQTTQKALLQIPGVGKWTTNYLLMRAVRWPDAFIDTDLGIIKAGEKHGFTDLLSTAEQWRPWRAYAAMQLWHSLSA
jgi:AraC family transcriptional regulator, regulatory protein of adaptative response / DNA-3-methyladenine glycosylase II